ncbi:hypothetical protein [Undibacterium luofuense]|uniref:Uncharacterized protein n=1 Tax=Undibacterium luofuense TaxID=2828733 RepID=A0A941DRN8_9BURK|nr:hypothetical protein [Undibacterium luofuense]MBR7783636.1 hypothetical protein [Undibacterium luofuense]
MSTFFVKQHALAVLALAAVLAGTGQQAKAHAVIPPASKWLDCLSFVSGSPTAIAYPKDAEATDVGVRVDAVFSFTAPDRGPEVRFEGAKPPAAFTAEVRNYASNMRLTCMDSSQAKVVLRQKFEFNGSEQKSAKALPVVDPVLRDRAKYSACLAHTKPGSIPVFPASARRDGREAHVFATLRFTKPDTAPEVTLIATSGQSDFNNSVTSYAEDLRVSCLGDEPFETTIHYKFVFADTEKMLLKNGPLAGFLKFSKADTKPAKFDFNTMSCPFDVKLIYNKPYLANSVRQLDSFDGARQPFLDWLKEVELQVDKNTREKIVGSNIVLSVPCGQLEF